MKRLKIKHLLKLYAIAVTMPFFLAAGIWQSNRFLRLQLEIGRLEDAQADLVDRNKRLIAEVVFYSSAGRIEYVAENELNLVRIMPEAVTRVTVQGEDP